MLFRSQRPIPADPWIKAFAVFGIDGSTGAINPHLALRLRTDDACAELMLQNVSMTLFEEMRLCVATAAGEATEVSSLVSIARCFPLPTQPSPFPAHKVPP